MTKRITISLPDQAYRWLKEEIEDGRYLTIAEAIREGLFLLRNQRKTVYLGGEAER